MTPIPDQVKFWYSAHVPDVFDGDTFDAVIDLGFDLSAKVKVRLAGVNAPEKRGASFAKGVAARDYVRQLILNKKVLLHTVKVHEKFGRYLAEVWFEREGVPGLTNLGQLMILEGHATSYLENRAPIRRP